MQERQRTLSLMLKYKINKGVTISSNLSSANARGHGNLERAPKRTHRKCKNWRLHKTAQHSQEFTHCAYAVSHK